MTNVIRLKLIVSLCLLVISMLFSAGCSCLLLLPMPYGPRVTGDGTGGAIAVYENIKGPDKRTFYAQKISPEGDALWGKKGVLIGSGYKNWDSFFDLHIVSDGSNSAIIAWGAYPSRSRQIPYVTHITKVDSEGSILWQREVRDVDHIVSDGVGGAIIATDYSYFENTLFVIKVDSEGNFPWGEDGIWIYCEEYQCHSFQLASDGSGGAIVIWQESLAEPRLEPHRPEITERIFAQRINSEGRMLWQDSGIPVASGSGAQLQPEIIDDGMGNFIIAWMESSHPRYDIGENAIYVQKIDSKGEPSWVNRGIPVCAAPKNQTHHQLASDGSGGCIVVWHDTRNRPNRDVYAQRVSSEGKILWEADGVLIWDVSGVDKSSIEAGSYDIQIIDDSTGAIVVWQANPKSATVGAFKGGRIYAQRLSSTGEPLWPEAIGVYENPSLKSQAYSSVVSDSAGGVIIGSIVGKGDWPDLVYAQRIDPEGNRLWGGSGVKIYH